MPFQARKLVCYTRPGGGLLSRGAVVRLVAEARAGWVVVEVAPKSGKPVRVSVKPASLGEMQPGLFDEITE